MMNYKALRFVLEMGHQRTWYNAQFYGCSCWCTNIENTIRTGSRQCSPGSLFAEISVVSVYRYACRVNSFRSGGDYIKTVQLLPRCIASPASLNVCSLGLLNINRF